MKTHIVKMFYCPRCDKRFYDLKSNAVAMQNVEDHIKKAHPDYLEMYKSGDVDA